MKNIVKLLLVFLGIFLQLTVLAQSVPQKLSTFFSDFQQDPQLRHGIASLYVVDAKSGKVLFAENEQLGLVPASTQKVITTATAYELLGKDFRYKTEFAYQLINGGAEILVLPSGDPTFGSWRWQTTGTENVLKNVNLALEKSGIKQVNSVQVNYHGWNDETIPDGWLWQDIGNYYGAGAAKLNWRENQFDVILKSGIQIGSAVSIVKISPEIFDYDLKSEVIAAAAGSGDSAYIYFPLRGKTATIRGTIPVNKNWFSISGAMPDPTNQFVFSLFDKLAENNIKTSTKNWSATYQKPDLQKFTVFHTVTSPHLDSIIYWINRKSVNLYAEALLKTIAAKNTGAASTGKGVLVMQHFWKQKGISEGEMMLKDGSGLSPLNRTTTQAQVKVLQYAQQQTWYNGFYNSLPNYNGMKMKSGTMQGVKGYCGYYRDKAGNEYIFSFLVNNFTGSPADITQKMYKVLDALK